MKKQLNNFAFWLYEKTLPEKHVDMGVLYKSKKIMVSKHIPKDTIIVGEGEKNQIAEAILNQEVKLN